MWGSGWVPHIIVGFGLHWSAWTVCGFGFGSVVNLIKYLCRIFQAFMGHFVHTKIFVFACSLWHRHKLAVQGDLLLLVLQTKTAGGLGILNCYWKNGTLCYGKPMCWLTQYGISSLISSAAHSMWRCACSVNTHEMAICRNTHNSSHRDSRIIGQLGYKRLVSKCCVHKKASLMKQQFAVTHTICHMENPALLHSWVTSMPSVKVCL